MAYESFKLFRDIAQTRSFSRGAAMNNVSQSAASQHVQDVERTLGIELLDRSSRPLVVTPAGQLYSEFCRDVLHRKEEFGVTLDRLEHEVEGTVRVAAIYSVALSEMVQIEEDSSRRLVPSVAELNIAALGQQLGVTPQQRRGGNASGKMYRLLPGARRLQISPSENLLEIRF